MGSQKELVGKILDAILNDDIEKIVELLNQGVDVNARDEDGEDLLTCALGWVKVEAAEMLLDHGAAIDGTDSYTTLSLAIQAGAGNIIEKVVESGADVNKKGIEDDQYPIHHIVETYLGSHFLDLLIRAGAEVNFQNDKGHTALDIVLMMIEGEKRRPDNLNLLKNSVERLLNADADVNTRDEEGVSTIERAYYELNRVGNPVVQEILSMLNKSQKSKNCCRS